MNSKRQTIWLVSMLSLMVVLSAYYLFTGNVNNMDLNAQKAQTNNQVKVDSQNVTGTGGITNTAQGAASANTAGGTASNSAQQGGSASAAVDSQTGNSSGGSTANSTQSTMTSSTSTSASSGASQSADQKILEAVQNQGKSGSSFFIAQEMKRTEQLSKESDQLMSVINSDQNAQLKDDAYNKLTQLQDTEAKVTNLEDELTQDFPNAIVVQDNNNWKVMVQANSLKNSQAVSIIDKAVKELNVRPDQVSVEFISN